MITISDDVLRRTVFRHTAERDKTKPDGKIWQKTRIDELKYGSIFKLEEDAVEIYKVDVEKADLSELGHNARYRIHGEWYAVRETPTGLCGFKVKGNVPLGTTYETEPIPLTAGEVDTIIIVPKVARNTIAEEKAA